MTENNKKQGRFRLPLIIEDKKKYYAILLAFALLGVGLGYLYYVKIGCTSGSCSLQSNPYFTMLWGGLLGYILPDFFVKLKKENKTTSEPLSEDKSPE
ncbi:MAG: hypothetical protein KGZ71_03610 [Desulfobulbaceae bacterium]|nr:hypothetical protein [Desulfobulbaceae bacterium]